MHRMLHVCTGSLCINILAYADDIVILSPSWRGLQVLLYKLTLCAQTIDMVCNPRQSVCMHINPQQRSRVIIVNIPSCLPGNHNKEGKMVVPN